MKSTPEFRDLFNRLQQGNLSREEAEDLISRLAEDPADPALIGILDEILQKNADATAGLTATLENKLPAIFASGIPVRRIPFYKRNFFRYSAAACIVFLLAAGWLMMNKKENIPAQPTVQSKPFDLPPGHEGAILTLDDNTTIVLDSMNNGVIASQNGSDVTLVNGRLKYSENRNSNTAVTYNTMTTPRGRQFQLMLPDSSQVWLDAASSIRFPTAFNEKDRVVEITGEAYFEIAKNPRKPFRVKIKNTETEVEVLGTHFNINAYTQETSINTTLFEGSVKVHHRNNDKIIKPGQQAQSSEETKIISNVNLRKVIAWKDGVFDFSDMKLQEVMHQLERWYDIDVVYEKGIPPLEFYGKMRRDLSLSEVLRGLEMSEVHFNMQGRKLVVKP